MLDCCVALIFAGLLVLSASGGSRADQAPLRVVGSDLIAGVLDDVIESASEAERQVEVELSGSRDGLRELREGSAALGIIAIPDGTAPPEDLVSIPVAFRAAVAIVHVENPATELSTRQLAALFGDHGRRSPVTWEEVALEGSWARRAVTMYGVRNPLDVSLELFRARVLDGAGLSGAVQTLENNAAVEAAVARDPSAIGIISRTSHHPRVRVIAIGREGSAFAHAPSADSIYFADYPLRLPLYVLYRAEEEPRAGGLVRALLGDLAARAFEAAEWVPAPEHERSKRALLIPVNTEQ